MKSLVWKGDGDGAVGFSTGLQYVPGTYAKTPEIIELARVAANAGGLYASHMRNEGTDARSRRSTRRFASARRAARGVQISHLKVDSPSRWGASAQALAMIDAARTRGVEVDADQYAYTAASSSLGIRFPSWALEGGQRQDRRAAERSGDLDAGSRREMPRPARRARAATTCRSRGSRHTAADPSLNGLSMKEVAGEAARVTTRRMRSSRPRAT